MDNFNWNATPESIRQNGMPFCGALRDYYINRFRNNAERHREKISQLTDEKTTADYIQDIRNRIKKHFNFPQEHTELKAETVFRREEKDHVIEGIIYFSRPGLAVSGLFMTPKTSGKHPGILFLCGHMPSGKLGYYQTIASDLARQGFAVLIIDPMGQGERRESELHPVLEHNLFGRRLGLAGESFAAWRTYDAVRGLDYLTSRNEVDSSVIGVTGCSGGCTLATYVMAVDERPTMVAFSCAITTWEHNVENEHPIDIEQLPQGLGRENLELADLLIAAAPRPMLVMGQSNDFFDLRGTREIYAELEKIYANLNHTENLAFFSGIGEHSYSLAQRFEMHKFFGNHVGLQEIPFDQLDLNPIKDTELYCAPEGKIFNIENTVSHDELAAECCRNVSQLRKIDNEDILRKKVIEKLAIGETFIPYYRVLRLSLYTLPNCFGRFALETEKNQAMCILKTPCTRKEPHYHVPENEKIMLYIGHLDSELEVVRKKFEFDGMVCPFDVRGIGEFTPCDALRSADRDFFEIYESDYHYAALGDFLGEPILGRRVHDILCCAELLKSRNCEVEFYGCGQGGIAALFAAFVGGYKVTLENIPKTYLDLANNYNNALPQALLPFDILKVCDLDVLIKYTNAEIIS